MSGTYPITAAVLDQVLARLSDDVNDGVDGYNAVYNGLAPGYSINADSAILFTPTGNGASPNFAKVNVHPDDWINSSAVKFPFMTLFGSRSVNQNKQKFHQFSGTVQIGLNVFWSWRSSRILINFDAYAACVEETVYTLFNRARNADQGDQDWGPDVVYNGDLELTPSTLARGEEYWSQLFAFRATFEVDQRGET